MLILISPAKSIDTSVDTSNVDHSEISFPKEAVSLVKKLSKKSPKQLIHLMHISHQLAELNASRFQTWEYPFEGEDAKQALLVFSGAVFQGMNPQSFSKQELAFVQDHLAILSGLYGLLKPLDIILPYRLEMGTKFSFGKNKHLYDFWGDKIRKKVQALLKEQGDDVLINLASNEYFKAVRSKDLNARIITPEFRDYKNGEYKMISFFAKKARGMMSAYILKNNIENPEEIKHFNNEGYAYNENLSKNNTWIFTRN